MNADGPPTRRRQWAWHVSALVYRWTDTAPSRAVDEAIFRFVGPRLGDARVLDCGCGPGGLVAQLAARGAGEVVAIDANAAMVRQTRQRLANVNLGGRAEVVEAFVDAEFFGDQDTPADVIVFKRSLYARRAAATAAIRAAAASLAPDGIIVIAQPERRLRRYAFGPAWPWVQPHTVFHLFNRALSRFAVAVGISDYRDMTELELTDLLADASPSSDLVRIPSDQWAYSVVALTAPSRRSGTDDTVGPEGAPGFAT